MLDLTGVCARQHLVRQGKRRGWCSLHHVASDRRDADMIRFGLFWQWLYFERIDWTLLSGWLFLMLLALPIVASGRVGYF